MGGCPGYYFAVLRRCPPILAKHKRGGSALAEFYLFKSASLWKLFLYQKIYLSCFAFKCLKVRYMCLLLSAKLNWLFAVEIPNLISNFHRIKKCPVYLGLINLKLCWLKELFQHISSLYFDWTNWPLVLYSWWVGEREKANKLQSLNICSIKFSGCNIEM